MAIIYVDASRPDNSGAGTSEATAKQTWDAGLTACAAGDIMRVRGGYCYAPGGGSGFDKITKNNLTVEAYGLLPLDYNVEANKWEQYPILDCLYWENSGTAGWTHEGDGVWSKMIGAGGSTVRQVKRLWVGCSNTGNQISQRVLGTARSRTISATTDTIAGAKAQLNSTDIWYAGGAGTGWKTFIYTGSTTVAPPTFYSGLAFLCYDETNLGSYNGVEITRCNGVNVTQIHARGPVQNCFWISSLIADTSYTFNNHITDCLGSCMYAAGFTIRAGQQDSTAHRQIRDCTINHCIGNTFTSELEQDKTTAWTYTSLLNMYELTGYLWNCHVRNCTTINSGHVSLVVGKGNNNYYVPEHCGFENHYTYWDDWATYGRGMSTNSLGTGCYVRNCVFDGQNIQSQIVDGYITGNVWKRNRASIRKTSTDSIVGFECYMADSGHTTVGTDRYVVLQPKELVFANNIIIDCQNPFQVLMFTTYANSGGLPGDAPAAPPINYQTCVIANNLIIDRDFPSRPWLTAFVNGGEIYTQIVRNNIVWTGSGGPAPTIKWRGTTYAVNAAPGESGTITSSPLLNETTLQVGEGSPAIGAGFFAGFYPDAAGKQFNIPPSIGIYENFDILPRTTRS